MRDALDLHRRVGKDIPRALELFGQRAERKNLSDAEIARRLEPILPMIATGELPLDKTSLHMLQRVAEQSVKDYEDMVKGEK